MKDLSRRFFMRAMGAVPGAAVAMDLQAKAAAHGVGLLPPVSNLLAVPAGTGNSGPDRFVDFAEFWKKFGRESTEERARHVSHFDPDILALVSVALPAKIRMQRARNFERLKVEQEKDFLTRVARNGHFQWWG